SAPGQTTIAVLMTGSPETVRLFVNGVQQDVKQGTPLECVPASATPQATPQTAPNYVPPSN
ncbi:MAG TPA: hypothetical protein VKQ72_13990, partial [Aggregatilineales bacterium]|nr:hypothetical protein [Aggregatilineales bacterium]